MRKKTMTLFVAMIRERLSSALWHSRCYPGRLALFADPVPRVQAFIRREIRKDFSAWHAAKQHMRGNKALTTLVNISPFGQTVMVEICELLCTPLTKSLEWINTRLAHCMAQVFRRLLTPEPIER